MTVRMTRLFAIALVFFVSAVSVAAQQINVPDGFIKDDAALASGMPAFAERLIAAYANPDREQYLDVLFRLQLVAGKYAEALSTLKTLREMRPAGALPTLANVRWEIYAAAKIRQAAEGVSFDDAFKSSFTESLRGLDDKAAWRVLWSFGTAVSMLRGGLHTAVEQHKSDTALSIADAVDLTRKSLGVQAFSSFEPSIAELISEDDRRRYIIEKDVAVKTRDGATVCALIVRPREGRRPALLNFTIYADPNVNLDAARRTASNGYAGVIGFPRGKGCSHDTPMPYEHDGVDAAALIDWIAAQPWSDGQAGMYGGSYEGFAVWAAAKQMPKPLKALMAGAPVGPGIDVPMEGNVFWSFVYQWPFYTTNVKNLDDATYNDDARWNRLNREWYLKGAAYRDMEKIDGTPNPIFAKWIAHPAYDAYWRTMIPYRQEFARITIPVLQTAGYFFGGPGAAVYYFTEHYKYRPGADHYLVVGPYDHVRGHSGTVGPLGSRTANISGYDLDPDAQLDVAELRYQWFDYTLKHDAKPAILKDKVNYEVMGANVWKHAPSLAAMAKERVKFHLTAKTSGKAFLLSRGKPAGKDSITLSVDLADRKDADQPTPGDAIVSRDLDTSNGIEFLSEPFANRVEISGLFSGHLDLVANKRDFDFNVALYELTPAGDYVGLAPYWSRASYAGHPGTRRLLIPGKRERIDFGSIRLMSRQFQSGSRLVVVLSVIKETGRQINYGTGKDVSAETIADAHEPLTIRWLTGSYIEVPIGR
jgi:putative CocE/NonD family hydrolase